MTDRYAKLLQECTVPAHQAAAVAAKSGMVIPEEKLDVTKFARLIVQECIWAFGETRTEPSLEKYILDRLGINHGTENSGT